MTTLTDSTPGPFDSEAPTVSSRAIRQPRSRPVQSHGAPIALLGIPFDNVTTEETVASIQQMVVSGKPHYLVTANVDFLVQAVHDVELRRILFEAHLVLCDGTPLVWASRWLGNPLPERVAGSDLVPLLIELAAREGYRVFFLGGSPETAKEAVMKLQGQYPNLTIAGHYSPPFGLLLEMDHTAIRRRIQEAKPELLFVSFGCPKQEKWIAMHYRSLAVPVCIGVGATIDFLAGRLPRAPVWMQRTGTEWIFRMLQEPRRLCKRYAKDCWYFGGLLGMQWLRMRRRSRQRRPSTPLVYSPATSDAHRELQAPEWLDAQAVQRDVEVWERALREPVHLLIDVSKVQFIDSTGVGLLLRLRKRTNLEGRQTILVGASGAVRRTLETMRLWSFFPTAGDTSEGVALLQKLAEAGPLPVKLSSEAGDPVLAWQGEVTATNADQVWAATEAFLASQSGLAAEVTIQMNDVSFVDSTGLGLMLRAKKYAHHRGSKLLLSGMQPNVRNVVRLAKLDAYLAG